MSHQRSNFDIAQEVFQDSVSDILIYTLGSIKNRYGMDYRELYRREMEVLESSFAFYCDVLLECGVVISSDMLYGWLIDELFRGFGIIKYPMQLRKTVNHMADKICEGTVYDE